MPRDRTLRRRRYPAAPSPPSTSVAVLGRVRLQQRLQLALAEVEGVAGADDAHAQVRQRAAVRALVPVVEAGSHGRRLRPGGRG